MIPPMRYYNTITGEETDWLSITAISVLTDSVLRDFHTKILNAAAHCDPVTYQPYKLVDDVKYLLVPTLEWSWIV